MCARTHSNTLRIIFPLAHGDVCLLNGQRQRSDAGALGTETLRGWQEVCFLVMLRDCIRLSCSINVNHRVLVEKAVYVQGL